MRSGAVFRGAGFGPKERERAKGQEPQEQNNHDDAIDPVSVGGREIGLVVRGDSQCSRNVSQRPRILGVAKKRRNQKTAANKTQVMGPLFWPDFGAFSGWFTLRDPWSC